MDIKELSSIRFLKSEFPDITSAQIDSVIDAFSRLKEKLVEAENAKKAKRENLVKAVEAFENNLAELGLTFSDAAKFKQEGGETTVREKKVIPPKYAYTDENGNSCTWTGRGRTPVAFAKLLESGRKAEEFLIADEQ